MSHSKFDLTIYLAKVSEKEIYVVKDNLLIDFCVLNNDQSNPIDINWSELSTPVHPSPYLGWYRRQKIHHFKHLHEVIAKFSSEFSVEPFLLQARFEFVEKVDFANREGIDLLAKKIDALKESHPSIDKVFVKASKGTYGMGIMVVSSGQEMMDMNRKERNKMDIGKNKIKFTDILIQEGVETILKYDEMPSEITIYLVGGKPVGGFMRANPLRDAQSNLNSKGMVFKKLCISEINQRSDHKIKEAAYSVIARLSSLASCYEICDSFD